MAGLESWGKLLGSTLLFNQARQTPVGLVNDTHTFQKKLIFLWTNPQGQPPVKAAFCVYDKVAMTVSQGPSISKH